jgi:cellulose synthase/poly-beta-1,6-N-acetylglucosamine synthase-like glycosyltransferase
MAEAVLWGAVGIIVYVYAGFPVLMAVLARMRPRPARRGNVLPTVTVVIAAYNEEAAIAGKLENTLASDYPADRLDVVVVSDGSTDRTDEIVTTEFAGRARLLPLGGRFGKTIGQNRAMEETTGDVVVFTDATTILRADTVRELVAPFSDPEVGCVGAWVAMGAEGGEAMAEGRQAYADYDQWLRIQESVFASILGTSGACYAVRRSAYTPLPADVISDMAQVVKVVQQGLRAVVEPRAVVFEPGESISLAEEMERRTRIMVRGLRAQWYLRDFFNPMGHPWFCWQILSHRLFRLAIPVFMMAVFVANLWLLDRPFFQLTLAGQLAFYGAAAAGGVLERLGVRRRVLMLPFYFCAVNVAPILAVREILRGERRITWETRRR